VLNRAFTLSPFVASSTTRRWRSRDVRMPSAARTRRTPSSSPSRVLDARTRATWAFVTAAAGTPALRAALFASFVTYDVAMPANLSTGILLKP
jgi:hypothetical protein